MSSYKTTDVHPREVMASVVRVAIELIAVCSVIMARVRFGSQQ